MVVRRVHRPMTRTQKFLWGGCGMVNLGEGISACIILKKRLMTKI